MTKTMSRFALVLTMLFCCSTKFYAQLSPTPTLAVTNVTEASQYGVLYQIDIPTTANYTSASAIIYAIDNSSLTLNYSRVAYFLQLDTKWVWVSMNKFNTTNAQLGVPYNNSAAWQQTVTGMNVYSSASSGVTNTTGISGNIEIWPDCYSQANYITGIGGNASTYDFNDTRSGTNCFGSFQVHNYAASQTIFAWNSFMNTSGCDLGIGTNTANANPDWTFMANANTYTTRKLWILVDKGINFTAQPSTVAKNACLSGTVSPFTVTTSVLSTTLTNYQWYSNTSTVTSGGTLVATHTSSLTTDSYTPLTSSAGTLYYYCIANGTNSTSATSNISGAVTVGNPTFTISGSGTICAGSALTLSATSTAAGSTFTWSTGENTANISVSPGVNTNYTVAGTSTLGCIGVSSPVTVTVNTLPVISVANGTICAGNSFVFSPSGASSYTYSSGSATVSPTSTTAYTISGTSIEGCVGTTSLVSVTVNTLPVVSITGTTALCEGSSATLTANGAATYTWSDNSNGNSISVNPTLTTTYSLSGTSSEGCISTLPAVTTLTVYTLPVVTATGTNQVCSGSSVSLTAAGATSYTWNTTETTSIITVTPSANTSYSVSGTSPEGCISANALITVSVNALPVISISSSTSSICAGATAGFTATGASSYTWDSGSNAASISVSPTANTSYSVSGTNSLGCVSASQAVVSVTVNALPTLSISGPSSICAGASASLTAGGASTYTFVGMGSTTPISVSPSVTTSYTLTGTNSVGCVGLPFIKTITVNALPALAVTGANSICLGATASLTASGAATYSWTGLGSPTVLVVSPTVTTVYTLTGTNASGCSLFTTKSVSVNALPSLTITGASGICTGQSATLSVSGASTYSWSTGATNSIIVTTPVSTTTYSVAGTNALGCSNTISQAVTVATSLSISITGPTVVCYGEAVNLGGLGGVTYTWNTGATSTTITPNPTVTTTYSVIGASGTCSNTALKTVSVNPNPTLTISGASTICEGNSTTLSAAGADSYVWSTTSTGTTIVLNPTVTTTYTVIGSFTTGCLASEALTITVNPLPTVSISGNAQLCSGTSTVLSASGASSYTWSNGATTNTISVTPLVNTTYSAIGTDANGCANVSSTTTLSVNPSPTVSLVSSNNEVCAGTSATLIVSGAFTYSWSNGLNTSTLVVTPITSTVYSATGTDSLGCSSSATISVVVNANPTLAISGSTIVCPGESVDLNVTGANSYTWSTGSTTASLTVTPSVLTTYSVEGTNSDGCKGNSAITVKIGDCTGLSSIAANNTISVYPNPTNGIFTIQLEDATNTFITVRNVVGQIILNKKAELVNSLSLSDFNNGVYYIAITKNNSVIYSKAVIKN